LTFSGYTDEPSVRWLEQLGQSVPIAVRRRIQQSLHLAKKCMSLEKEVERLKAVGGSQEREIRNLGEQVRRPVGKKLSRYTDIFNTTDFIIEVLSSCGRLLPF
jgi:hypothetical protein